MSVFIGESSNGFENQLYIGFIKLLRKITTNYWKISFLESDSEERGGEQNFNAVMRRSSTIFNERLNFYIYSNSGRKLYLLQLRLIVNFLGLN